MWKLEEGLDMKTVTFQAVPVVPLLADLSSAVHGRLHVRAGLYHAVKRN